jgi:hypothetical protein
MVIARYGVPGMATGSLGVLGPMRMSYSKTIPTVRFVAALLSDLVNDNISVNKTSSTILRACERCLCESDLKLNWHCFVE